MSKYYSLARRNQNDLVEPFFQDFFNFPFGEENLNQGILKTDITDEGDHYLLSCEVPEIPKENLKISLEDGYLTIHATRSNETPEDKKEKKYVRRERFYGSYSRSYYVGDDVKNADISAKLDNGVLKISVKKHENEKHDNNQNLIEIC